ncbi:type II secretion system F family protein [Thermanaeromonas toyohensis]|uniref:type II secretion system F family protein n=1 Tax=Thermanaeromonas toyohensis TaxID=161154 RepID=UPI0015605CA1|nr:type II secretion system F family protein [Thermanaeromonas toyohensis]
MERLQSSVSESRSAAVSFLAHTFGPAVLVVFPDDVRLRTRQRLIQAGIYHMDAADFLALKLAGLLGMVLFVVTLAVVSGRSPAWSVLSSGIGYVLPEVWLDARLKRRRAEIEKAAPDFAVLLSAVLAAGGVGINEALKEVGERIGGELGLEVKRTFIEIASGKRRGEALEAMAERCGVAEISEVVRCIRSAERFGVPIAEALRDMAAQVYQMRRARAEEKLGRAQVAVIVPMMLFFILPLLLMLFFPAIVKLSVVLHT